MESFLTSLSESWVASIMFGWAWSWPIAETIHFFGMTILFGAIAITDLRLVGCFKKMPIQATHILINIAIVGFVLNLITGIGFYCADPFRYTPNWSFQLKMFLIVLAGLNALFFTFKLQPTWGEWDQYGTPPQIARIVGGASLVLWTFVIIFGRLIPYLSTG
ncbi:MAG: hypothetical protein HOL48_05080 [Porticoccaceae bacterium]|jgi:hypothetical protein|nr:hypothetical protein [Porticoccaceae bacterium]